MTIPKIIWQTYKDPIDTLPEYAIECINSWKNNNPSWEYHYMDDSRAENFVLSEYGPEWHKIFVECPVGVMRGDLWRYLIIYKYGGFYADLDTYCRQSLDTWFPFEKEMVVCPENDVHFCQWAFASIPGHPFFKTVLDVIKEGFKNPDYKNPHFVHSLTGPAVWTKGILTALGENHEGSHNLVENTDYYNNLPEAIKNKFYCYGGDYWRIFHHMALVHIYGSQQWNDGRYVRWIAERVEKVPNEYDIK